MIRLAAGCYGKLPFFGDFVRFNSDSAENEIIDRWFCDGAANLLGGSDDSALATFDQVPPVCCIFRARHHRRRVGAVIIASRDRVGRRYPFAITCGLDDQVFRGEIGLLLAAFIPFFDRALQADLGGWSEDIAGLSQQISQVDADVDLETQAHLLVSPLAKMGCVEFWGSLFGSFEDPRKYIAIANLIAQLTDPQSTIYGLRFPPIATQAHVIFWPMLSWLLQGRGDFPEMIAMQTGRPGLAPGMTMLWGHPPTTVHFAALWPSCKGVGSSAGIFEVAGALRHGATLTERYRELLDDPELMVDGLIYGLLAASKSGVS